MSGRGEYIPSLRIKAEMVTCPECGRRLRIERAVTSRDAAGQEHWFHAACLRRLAAWWTCMTKEVQR